MNSIIYCVEDAELCGGTKVIFQHAQLLHELGFLVKIACNSEPPNWRAFSFEFVDCREKSVLSELRADLVIATYWTTMEMAEKIAHGKIAHFCQGYEADQPHLSPVKDRIESVYRKSCPCLVVSPHLGDFLRNSFAKTCYLTRPYVDEAFDLVRHRAMGVPPKIVLHGIFENPIKGVKNGLLALKSLRDRGVAFNLIRFSLLEISDEETDLFSADSYYVRARPDEVAAITEDADLLLFPSIEGEGLGLPVLEAVAIGVPVVATDISSMRWVLQSKIPLVPVEDFNALADRMQSLLADSSAWQQARVAGYALAENYRKQMARQELELAVNQVLS